MPPIRHQTIAPAAPPPLRDTNDARPMGPCTAVPLRHADHCHVFPPLPSPGHTVRKELSVGPVTEKVACRTPADGRDGVTSIPATKFDMLSDAILTALADRPVAFGDLKGRVAMLLPQEKQAQIGALRWHVTTVKLEMEGLGQIRRVPGVTPQHIEVV